jgi:hypothetical protein
MTMQAKVGGAVVASGALGVDIANSTVGGSVAISGGGGGARCATSSIGEPDDVTVRDVTLGGGLTMEGVATCEIGVVNDRIHGNVLAAGNSAGDRESDEITQDLIGGDLACAGDLPAVQFGRSGTLPNVVGGRASGECSFTTHAPDPALEHGGTEPLSIPARLSYWVAAAGGAVAGLGLVHDYGRGGAGSSALVGLAPTADAGGYWLAAADGTVQPRGDARSLGDLAGTVLSAPIVGIVATPDGRGYWLAAADGGVFAFGDARFEGSLHGDGERIVGIAATPDGRGYWLAGAGGGVFAFGDARFYGSEGGAHLNGRIVAITASPSGGGYWLLGADGGVFAFGNARFRGSLAGQGGAAVALLPAPGGLGYWVVGAGGGVTSFGEYRGLVAAPSLRFDVAAAALLP